MAEKIIYSYYGISKTANIELTGDVSINQENAIIITDKRILFINIPLPGSQLSTVRIMKGQFDADDLKLKGDELIRKLGIEKVYSMNSSNKQVMINDISKVKFTFWGTVKFTFNNGEKISYTLYNRKDKDALKKALSIIK